MAGYDGGGRLQLDSRRAAVRVINGRWIEVSESEGLTGELAREKGGEVAERETVRADGKEARSGSTASAVRL